MPLYNDKDALLDMLIDETNSEQHSVREEISNLCLKISQLETKREELEERHDWLCQQSKLLKMMFKDYNHK